MGCAASVPVSVLTNVGIEDLRVKLNSKSSKGKVHIFYGSTTGTAEGFARTMMKEACSHGFDSSLTCLSDFKPECLQAARLAMFIVATYGDGGPTDNAVGFHTWLHDESTAKDYLSNTHYCVFGLGNRSYDFFDGMGKLTDSGLSAVGAKRICDLGEADDSGSTEDDFEEWRAVIWSKMTTYVNSPAYQQTTAGATGVPCEQQRQQQQKGQTEKLPHQKQQLEAAAEAAEAQEQRHQAPPPRADSEAYSLLARVYSAPLARVLVNRELCTTNSSSSSSSSSSRSGGGRNSGSVGPSVRHLELDLTGTGLTYTTADNLLLQPENRPALVDALAVSQGYDLEATFLIPRGGGENADNAGVSYPFKPPLRVRTVLSKFLDLQGRTSRTQLRKVIPYLKDDDQKAWLVNLLQDSNKNQFRTFVDEDGKSLADMLTHELSSAKIPLADLIHICTYMQPRYYTISSSSSVHPSTVHITISITQFPLKSGRIFSGVASHFLANASVGANCRILITPSSFRLPAQVSTPIVMVAGGSGLAPMRALLMEREWLVKQQQQQQQQTQKKADDDSASLTVSAATVGAEAAAAATNVLFFGCKNRGVDYIYREELEGYQARGSLTQLHTAFSRDGPTKVYVQGLMTECTTAESLGRLLCAEGAHVYVCGATAMGSDVMGAFSRILQRHKGWSESEAAEYLKSMIENKRYVRELWTAS